MLSKTFIAFAFLISLTVFVSGCTGASDGSALQTPAGADDLLAEPGVPLWLTAELKDVATGETFTINDFKGSPVLVESFAVWCPVCTRQQQEISKFHDQVGDSVVSVSLDADPNEDEARVRDHIQRNGFDWYYAIVPSTVTSSLVDDFGLSITNVPLAPMVLICGDQTTHRLRNGVKSADELSSSVNELCGV